MANFMRSWLDVSKRLPSHHKPASLSSQKPLSFTVMSYNILARKVLFWWKLSSRTLMNLERMSCETRTVSALLQTDSQAEGTPILSKEMTASLKKSWMSDTAAKDYRRTASLERRHRVSTGAGFLRTIFSSSIDRK
jgi:hypothetical protein